MKLEAHIRNNLLNIVTALNAVDLRSVLLEFSGRNGIPTYTYYVADTNWVDIKFDSSNKEHKKLRTKVIQQAVSNSDSMTLEAAIKELAVHLLLKSSRRNWCAGLGGSGHLKVSSSGSYNFQLDRNEEIQVNDLTAKGNLLLDPELKVEVNQPQQTATGRFTQRYGLNVQKLPSLMAKISNVP